MDTSLNNIYWLLERVKSISNPARRVLPRRFSVPETCPEEPEEVIVDRDESDCESLGSIQEEETKTDLTPESTPRQKNSTLKEVFSVIFDPEEALHNFWSGYRFLQTSPRRILYDTGDIIYLQKKKHWNYAFH